MLSYSRCAAQEGEIDLMRTAGFIFQVIFSVIVFIAVLILGAVFTPVLLPYFNQFPGSITISSGSSYVTIPVLASIVSSLLLTLVINLIALPFRRRNRTITT